MGCLSRRRFLGLASVVGASVAGASLLGACAPKTTPEPEAPAQVEEKAPAAPAPKGPVVLQLHLRAGGEQSEPPIYVTRPAEFMEEHPDIKVELAPIPGGEYDVKILTMAAAQTLGDVIWTADVWTDHTRYVNIGVVASVDEFLDTEGVSKDEWLPACVDTLSQEGKMYGLPKCSHPGDSFIHINEEMFEAAGIPIPETHGNSPEDVMEWAEKLAKGPEKDREVFGIMPSTGQIMAIVNGGRQFGTYENNEAGTESLYDAPEWLEWVRWIETMYRRGLAPQSEHLPAGGLEGLFASQRIGMFAGGRWTWNQARRAAEEAAEKPFRWTTIAYPRTENALGWIAGVDTHSATTHSKHPLEAFQLIYALADQRFTELVAENIGYLTGRVDDIDTIQPFITPWLQLQYDNMLEEDRFRQPANVRGREVETAIKNELSLIWLGEEEATPAFMERLKSAADAMLEKPF
jgi:ABC-type glycerol-3-phosphate transport system substrate-binding protein